MLYPIKVVDVELSLPLQDIEGLDGYMQVQALVRWHSSPIGYIKAPITNGKCLATSLSKLILEEHSETIINRLLENGLAVQSTAKSLKIEDLFDVSTSENRENLPLVTVAVCTRDRTSDLALCLAGLKQLDYPNLDILIVDNAPSNDATKKLVENYPDIRYVCEPRPGLDWARNRAIIEAKGEILAYTDDDVVVDSGWVKALAKVFVENSKVMAVTGLVVPLELETEAQVLFEMYGGFGKGFERKWYRVSKGYKMPWQLLGAGQFGTGANMAYRRCVFDEIGYFDPALDVGTVTNGAGDLEMFFRVIKEGHALVYEPNAIIRHRHRRDYESLRKQITNNGSLYAYFFCGALSYLDQIFSFTWISIWWMCYWNIRRLLISFVFPSLFPRDLIVAELWGSLKGLTLYPKARKNAAKIIREYRDIPSIKPKNNFSNLWTQKSQRQDPIAVRTVELSEPIEPLTDITDYSRVRVFATWKKSPIGSCDISNQRQVISANRLIEEIVKQLNFKLIKIDESKNQALAALNKRWKLIAQSAQLPVNIPVSIVVATLDRPDDLRKCLQSLAAQKTQRVVEIVVVDNNPDSGLTPAVVAEFPGVVLVNEKRRGLAYARNAGFLACMGDIAIATDDDVTVPHDWLEKLVAPFAREDVMVVTGNTLPIELETRSQRLFEEYGDGGLGRGFEEREADNNWFTRDWFRAVPTWKLGATANAAFRTSIFRHPEIGLMNEALGPGMPSGVGEDIYVFYKVLKAGYTIVYEPTAQVWHKHRRDMKALRRQLYGYSKGIISYNLTTLLVDGDRRVLPTLIIDMPIWHLKRIYYILRGWNDYPIGLILLEIAGNFAGPWSLWQSYRRVKREGRSNPYVPVSQRQNKVIQVESTISELVVK
ncbi:glycosyltransferase family 2 protein [Rivularia sp. UHCC 0363]|uniref:glycosyltransferase family 2 protein n=1 Tax=Rivularia sp. UHCC 0363 TaxID=3110244 RepID=UPI002B21B4F7|nr:glycosyltransferase [Rivularia sp. UHCC 0363]MEA5593353.1 glycosyltransferase [Rivularia sp. UHCC 0363]